MSGTREHAPDQGRVEGVFVLGMYDSGVEVVHSLLDQMIAPPSGHPLEHDVAAAEPGQPVQDRAAAHAAPDHHDFRPALHLRHAPDAETSGGHLVGGGVAARVAADGDMALREYGERFDGWAPHEGETFQVPKGDLIAAANRIPSADRAALEAALARNVWRAAAPVGAAASLARIVSAQAAHLATQPLATLVQVVPKPGVTRVGQSEK